MPTEDERLIFDQSRTVSWASTAPFHPRMAKMSGREVLEAIQAGLLAPPPVARLILHTPRFLTLPSVTASPPPTRYFPSP